MLKGSSITTLDKWGRVKIPIKFRRIIEDKYGKDVFVTSLDDENVQIYPLSEWKRITLGVNEIWRENQALRNFMIKINYNGMKASIDKQGRILIHKDLPQKNKAQRQNSYRRRKRPFGFKEAIQ